MNVPRLEIYLDENSKLCIAKVDRLGASSQLIVDVDLNELKSHGLDGASSRLGRGLINNLSLWHKKEFENWGLPVAQEIDEPDDFSIAQCLIEKSVLGSTAVHVRSIDTLLRQEAEKSQESKSFFEDTWPTIRERLESFGT